MAPLSQTQSWNFKIIPTAAESLCLELSGSWKLAGNLPSTVEIKNQFLNWPTPKRVVFDTRALESWDTGLLTFLNHIEAYCHSRKVQLDSTGLPQGVRRLFELAHAVPKRIESELVDSPDPLLSRIGMGTCNIIRTTGEMLEFIGQAFLAFLKLLQGKARFQKKDLFLVLYECGAQALPIVSLISVLVGLTLAFVGAVQLQQFGAEIYVANLVGLGMVRVMGAMMAGIIMAGRTGAAFAAQLGTMRVNEEMDALTTMGISPMEFLVLPRLLALMLMMPLLCLYADFLGILGGAFVGWSMLDISPMEYFIQTKNSIDMNDFLSGLIQSAAFGVLVAVSGCIRGMQCGKSSAAVGNAATSAVVTGIVFIVIATSVFTVIFNILDF